MPCERFPSAEATFARVLETNPLILGVGETHAQLASLDGGLPSTTRRFADSLLPMLEGRASDLVLELWVANGACGAAEQKVAARQKPATETQAPTNQNEFIALGEAAKKRGIRPHVLVPACDEYARILDAGGGDIDEMLSMIARLTLRDAREFLAQRGDSSKALVLYGGAMHNDLVPRPGREAWSYGPALAKDTQGRYVEIDLIVPEFIRDTEVWRSQPWYPYYDSKVHKGLAVLLTMNPSSYALIFPPSA
jgi:hypothetical protein